MEFQKMKREKTLTKRKYLPASIMIMRFNVKDVLATSGATDEDKDVIIDDIFAPLV